MVPEVLESGVLVSSAALGRFIGEGLGGGGGQWGSAGCGLLLPPPCGPHGWGQAH